MMNRTACVHVALACLLSGVLTTAPAAGPDLRLKEVAYDPHAVVTVAVKRGVVTLIAFDADEAITDVAAGLGGDCSKPDAAWCIAAQPGGRNVFVKPKSAATTSNNLVVLTDKRTHTFRLDILEDRDARAPVYRLAIKAASRPAAVSNPPPAELIALLSQPAPPAPPPPEQIVAERLLSKPQVVNTDYTVAQGAASQDIVPSLVFDDGRFTYLQFPGNREVPAVFHVLGDGGETLVNTRMEDDLLVVDRVSRQFTLRAGAAVVGLWNEAFDADGKGPEGGTTVPGVQRVLRPARPAGGLRHE